MNVLHAIQRLLLVLAISHQPLAFCLDFTAPKSFPELGVKIPMLAHAVALPERMPQTQMLFFHDAGGDYRLDFFSPLEMWHLHQLVGQWLDADANLFRLARVTHRPPEPDAPLLTHDDFQAIVLSDDNRLTSRSTRAELIEWVETFTRSTVTNTREIMINRFALDGALLLTLDDPATTLYLLRPRFPDGRPSDWFALLLKTPSVLPAKELSTILDGAVLPAIATLSRFEKPDPADTAAIDQTRLSPDTPGGPGHSVRVIARRTVAPYPAWRVTELDHAILLSNVPKSDDDVHNREITRLLSPLRDAFAKHIPPFSDAPDIAVVRIVASPLMFQRYAGENQQWAAGVYVPARRELVLQQGVSLDETLRVFKHESFHQYLHGAFAGLPAPAWFNEGHAAFFEAAMLDATGAVVIKKHPAFSEILSKNIDAFTELLPELLTWSYEDFYAGADDERRFRYALAWSFIYYLHKGAPLEFRAPHAAIISDFSEALRDTGDPDEATAQTFADIDLSKLQSAYQSFWR